MSRTIIKYIPGLLLTSLIAIAATYISKTFFNNLVGSTVIALFLGVALHPLIKSHIIFRNGITFTSKRLLRLAIIGMGVTLHLKEVIAIGSFSLIVMLFTLATAFGGGWLLGKVLKMPWRQAALISAGTGICGGSAIAALSPVINAKNKDVAYALSATFIFDVLMVILFPIMGKLLNMSDAGYGLWTGTAVNDTSSVLAAGYAFSENAGSFAIIVKLARTLSIVPIVLAFSLIEAKNTKTSTNNKVSIVRIFPWFVLIFFGVVIINSFSLINGNLATYVSGGGKWAMVMALAAVGLSTDALHLAHSGAKPMFHGFVISLAVVVVSYVVQMMLNQI
ncbi:MAG: YeiH family protein [Sphaerochaetaceae bacterium]